MNIGTLKGKTIAEEKELLAPIVRRFLETHPISDDVISVVEIDPTLSDTAAFCAEYGVESKQAANCVIIEVKRGEDVWYVACVVLADTKVDVNGLLKKHLDVRKASFAPMEKAVEMTGMEFGAITPIGLPSTWNIIIDSRVVQADKVIIGSGIRKSKLIIKGSILKDLPNVTVLQDLGIIK